MAEPDAQTWKVVGGEDTGGILVRIGKDLSSKLAESRLSTGSIVRQVALKDGRLQYNIVSGSGPPRGWVSLKLKLKDLLIQVSYSPFSTLSPKAETQLDPDSISRRLKTSIGGRKIATFAMG